METDGTRAALLPEQLPPRLVNVYALVAGVTDRTDSLVRDLTDLEMFEAIVDAFASGDERLTKVEIAERVGTHVNDSAFQRRFDLLYHHGAIKQARAKHGTATYVIDPLSLLAQELFLSLATRDGIDRLHERVVLAADRLQDPDVDLDTATDVCRGLTRLLSTFAADLERTVDLGTTADLIRARPTASVDSTVERVDTVAELTRDRFPQLEGDATRMWDATERFTHAINALADRLIDEALELTGGGLLTVLSEHTYRDAARTAPADQLAAVAADNVFDAPRPTVDITTLLHAADELGSRRRSRTLIEPADDTPGDVAATITARAEASRRRQDTRIRHAERILGSASEVELTGRMDTWPDAVTRFADALAVAQDPTVPITADISREQLVEPDATVSLRFPTRIRRRDRLRGRADQPPTAASDEVRR